MEGLDLFYLGAACSKNRKPFFIKYCKGADGVWVRMQGLKELQPADNKEGKRDGMPSDLKNIRVSPRYSCPHCGSGYCGSDIVDLQSGKGLGGQIDIMLVFDTSGSMAGNPIIEAKKAADNLVSQLDLVSINIGLAVFAESKKIAFPPLNDKNKIHAGISTMDRIEVGCGTSAIPFNIAYQQFKSHEAKKYMIVLTDGQWSNQKEAIAEANKFKSKGIEIIAIGFGDVDKSFLQAIASSPEKALYTDLSKLAKQFSEFTLSIIAGKGQ